MIVFVGLHYKYTHTKGHNKPSRVTPQPTFNRVLSDPNKTVFIDGFYRYTGINLFQLFYKVLQERLCVSDVGYNHVTEVLSD